MCRAVTCRKCGKVTWAGCGMHVNQVLAVLPKAERCEGHDAEPKTGIFSRIFGSH